MTEEVQDFTAEQIAAETARRNANKEQALKYADQVAAAVAKKLPEYKFYPRLIEAPEYNFIELGIQPVKGSVMDEMNVAYSQAFFEEMSDGTVKQARAKRVFKDVRIVLGIPVEDEA